MSAICWFPALAIASRVRLWRKALSYVTSSVVALANCAPPPKRQTQAPAPAQNPSPPPLAAVADEPVKESRYDRALAAIRISPLGLLVQAYLFPKPHMPKVESEDITKRVYSRGGRSISALSALHLLIHDMAQEHSLTSVQQTRLIMRLLFGKPAGPQRPIFSGARTYDAMVPIKTFFSFFGPFTVLYFFWFDWKESARGHSVGHRIDSSMDENEFKDVLEDLRTL